MRLRLISACWSLSALPIVGGCRVAAPADESTFAVVEAARVDEEIVRGLRGYRSEVVGAPVFGGQVFVMEAGDPDAPGVVLVHGLGESGCRDWYPVLPALAARYHVVAFDLPGFGRSTHANELYSPDRYAQFMHQLLEARLHAPFNLVGHSMGGALSLLYAARFPGEVARLVLIDVAGVLHRKAFVNFAVEAGLDNLLGLFARLAKDVATEASETSLTPMGSAMFPISPDLSLLLNSEALRSAMLGSPTRIAALAVLLENFAPAIDGVRSPSWILWGTNDAVASPRTGLILQARLPSARLTLLDGSGHDPMASRPAEVERFLLDALASPAVAVAPKPASWFPVPSDHKGRCERERGARFSGDYAEIDIDRCDEVVLRDVRTSVLRIRNSSFVTVENTRVVGQAVALDVKDSRVVITASDFMGDVAVEVAGSEIDLAGVDLRGRSAAVHVGGLSKLIFSVSRAESPIARCYLHDVYELDKGAKI